MHTETYWRDQAMNLAALLESVLTVTKKEAETMTALTDALSAAQQNTASIAHAAASTIAQLKAEKVADAQTIADLQAQVASLQGGAEDPAVMQSLIDGENAIGAELTAATQG